MFRPNDSSWGLTVIARRSIPSTRAMSCCWPRPPLSGRSTWNMPCEQGRHVFMEKSFAVDVPGVRRVLRPANSAAQKNLKIAGGLMSRHYRPLEEAVAATARRRHRRSDHLLGLSRTRPGGSCGIAREGMSELAYQIQNYSCFTWVNGSFLLDWLIHNLDVCCWCKDAWPVAAQGQGGRQVRTDAGSVVRSLRRGIPLCRRHAAVCPRPTHGELLGFLRRRNPRRQRLRCPGRRDSRTADLPRSPSRHPRT